MAGALEAASDFGVALTQRAPEWAVALALLGATAGIVVCTVTAMLMAARKLLGMGATPDQVAALLDKKVNGSLDRLERRIEKIDATQDTNAERMARVEERVDFMMQRSMLRRAEDVLRRKT